MHCTSLVIKNIRKNAAEGTQHCKLATASTTMLSTTGSQQTMFLISQNSRHLTISSINTNTLLPNVTIAPVPHLISIVTTKAKISTLHNQPFAAEHLLQTQHTGKDTDSPEMDGIFDSQPMLGKPTMTQILQELQTQCKRLDQHDNMFAEIQRLTEELDLAKKHIETLEETNHNL
ncbi:hypothetical protein BDC45DRAFT_561021 [Circinella umbellata]|nr:hypothetical protein BDC45DRAFT_561021 [Circinella umbellata]